jgi:3-carboxy-cis,cis-muconate cycloisomerase
MSLYDGLFRYEALDNIYSDGECVQSMLIFEAALARAAARAGIITEPAARAIGAKCRVEHFDMEEIKRKAAIAGNAAIPLVKQLTELVAAEDIEAAGFVHWGATSQDVIDTGSVMQMRRALELVDQDLGRMSGALRTIVERHRETPIVARTWMQQAMPTTFGFIVAGWLDGILRHRQRLAELRPRVSVLQFGGAVGTLAAFSGKGLEVAKALSDELHLPLPEIAWHTHRDRMAEVGAFLGLCMGTLGKIARDISLHTQTEVAELSEPGGEGRGGSSTMPHKRNPVTCAAVLAAAVRVPGLVSTIFTAMIQEEERGLGGWHAEWETLPEIVSLTGGALHHLAKMMPGLEVNSRKMLENLEITRGLIFAEAVSMALGRSMGKSGAHALVEKACQAAVEGNKHLKEALLADASLRESLNTEEIDRLFEYKNYLGNAGEFIDRVLEVAGPEVASSKSEEN